MSARRFFVAGSVILGLGGALHMWGQFGGGPTTGARAAIEAVMSAYTEGAPGMRHSFLDVMQCWGVLFGVLAMFAGAQNLILLGAVSRGPALLRRLRLASGLCAAVLVAVAVVYRIPQPAVVFGVALLCFAAALADRDRAVRAIARAWHGAVPAGKADAYFEYLARTGVPGCRATPGNLGVYVLRRVEQDRAHFLFISLWRSREAIEAFAGADIEQARYYPEDKNFLLELEPHVTHYEVLVGPGLGAGAA